MGLPITDFSPQAEKERLKQRRKYYNKREKQIEALGGIAKILPRGLNPTQEEMDERKEYLKSLRPRRNEHPCYDMWSNAKHRSVKQGVAFDLDLEDLEIPTHCALLGIPLLKGSSSHSDSSPTLNKIIPNKGYVKGNVQIISMRANRIKDNATFEEFERVYLNWKG